MNTPTRTLIVLEDSLIMSMAAQSSYRQVFPFLSGLAETQKPQRRPGCRKCGPARSPQRQQLMMSIKQAMANMGSDAKRQLKQMLNARQVRIYYFAPGTNRRVEVTF